MVEFYLVPSWFFELGFLLELLFGIITLAVAFYSYKVYRYCEIRECKLFGWGFLSLALSYLAWAFVSGYISLRFSEIDDIVSLGSFGGLVTFGVLVHAFLFIIGWATLVYITLGVKNQRVYTIIVSLALITLIFSTQKIVAFYFVASLFLFYLVIYYTSEHIRENRRRSPLILIAFIFLFLGSVDFTFSAVNHINYVVGHVFYLIGYLFILANFILMLVPFKKNDKEKNKA